MINAKHLLISIHKIDLIFEDGIDIIMKSV